MQWLQKKIKYDLLDMIMMYNYVFYLPCQPDVSLQSANQFTDTTRVEMKGW